MEVEQFSTMKPAVIRPYRPADQVGWVRCRVLAFLDTPYYDNVLQHKEQYANPAIELVAECNGQIVGFLDIEYEEEPGSVCSPHPTCPGRAGMIWHLGVHPDWRGRRIGVALLQSAVAEAKRQGLQRLEAWTRDDAYVQRWYSMQGFQLMSSYYHVYITETEELRQVVHRGLPKIKPVSVFAHYAASDAADVLERFERVHRCNRYDLVLAEP